MNHDTQSAQISQKQDGRNIYKLKTSNSGVCLDQNWMFVDREEEEGESPKFRLFFADVINE